MDYEAAPFALASDEGERLVFGDVTVLIKASCETTGGAFTIFEEGPPLLDTPRHVHANEDEVFHVLEGEHIVECGDVESVSARRVDLPPARGSARPSTRCSARRTIAGAHLSGRL